MTYESTGEVRAPRDGEYYLSEHSAPGQVNRSYGDWSDNTRKVILRPMGTPGDSRIVKISVECYRANAELMKNHLISIGYTNAQIEEIQ